MRSVNKVVLLGHVTRDAEFKQLEGGKAVCNFGLATNRLWEVENGEKHEDTEFHRIVAWDNWAKLCQKYMKKGDYSTLKEGCRPDTIPAKTEQKKQ